MLADKINDIELEFLNNRYEIKCDDTFFKQDLDELCRLNDIEIILMMIQCDVVSGAKNCPDCNILLDKVFFADDRHPFLRCSKRTCKRNRISIFKNTIFDNTKISFKTILEILYYFSCRRSLGDCSETLNISKPTVISFTNYLEVF